MHQVIDDIIASTEKRNKSLPGDIRGRLIKKPYDKGVPAKYDHNNKFEVQLKSAKKDNRVAVISEVKPASPNSNYRTILPADAARISKDMEKAGACAISVLTEPEFFHGSIENLKSVKNTVSLPVLRKDFIIDTLQMDECECDLILLITGILGNHLNRFIFESRLRGFEPLVEVHNEQELEIALESDAKIIGINNRNLSTMEIDLGTTERLIPLIHRYDQINRTEHIIISESGISTESDIIRVSSIGADAILVGTSIIKSDDIYSRTKEMVECLK